MAKALTIYKAVLLGGTSFVQYRFVVTEGATTLKDEYYNFSANMFSCVYDNEAPNMAVLHLGLNHTYTLSNGLYATITFDGTPYSDEVSLTAAFVNDIAAYTT